MKIIDLLNKIANGEELPRKLKGNNHTYTLVENRNYEDEDGDILFSDDYFWCNEDFLNKELEIIEEEKEIEKGLKPYKEYLEECDVVGFNPTEIRDEYIDRLSLIVIELIDEVNKLKGDKNE
jgi:hypothetical protein